MFARRLMFAAALSTGLIAQPSLADVVIATPADYTSKIPGLKPGDILELQAGRYSGGLPVYGLNGTSSQPITIRGPISDSASGRAVFEGSNTNNVIRVRNSSFLIIQNLEVDGLVGGVPRYGFGLSNEGSSSCPHDIVVENLYIHDLVSVTPPIDEDDRQVVGIALNSCTAWNWTLRGNRFERVGLGMYLGHSSGNEPFFSGVIEYNTFIDTIGYNIEIKHQNVRPTIAGMPTGDSRTIIRHNVFSKNASSSAVSNARPNLLVGHMPPSGPGQNDRYEIYGNFFFQNATEVLFQGTGNIYFYDNVMFNSQGTAMRIMPHEGGAPQDVRIFNNTVVASETGISIGGGASGYVQEVFGNAVFGATPISAANIRDNVTGNFAAAATYLNNPTSNIAQLDLYPKSTALTGSAINYGSVASPSGSTLGPPPDYLRDFNGTTQPGTGRGAYVYAGSSVNPGWKLALSRKPTIGDTTSPPPPPVGAPTVSIMATPSNVALNQFSQLTWTSSGAASCSASGAWSGAKAAQGSEQVGPHTANAAYTLTCTNASGSASASATVTLAAAPTVALTASPTSVASGGRTTLSWTATNAQTCAASGAWAGNKAVGPASEQSAALVQDSNFVLSCTGPGGSASASANVTVTASAPTPTPTPPPTAAGESDSGGGAWSIAGLCLLAAGLAARRVRHYA